MNSMAFVGALLLIVAPSVFGAPAWFVAGVFPILYFVLRIYENQGDRQ